jgi:uncharacterized membrane protein YgdD (TMEM256/DUF423 family)
MNAAKLWLTLAGLLGALGVGLGAHGAHGLEPQVKAIVEGHPPKDASMAGLDAEIAHRMDNWRTAVHYQMMHVAGLLAIGLAAARWPMKRWSAAGAMMLLGILLFSGVLYHEAIAPYRRLDLVVMFGGISYIVGWLLLAAAALGISHDATR